MFPHLAQDQAASTVQRSPLPLSSIAPHQPSPITATTTSQQHYASDSAYVSLETRIQACLQSLHQQATASHHHTATASPQGYSLASQLQPHPMAVASLHHHATAPAPQAHYQPNVHDVAPLLQPHLVAVVGLHKTQQHHQKPNTRLWQHQQQ